MRRVIEMIDGKRKRRVLDTIREGLGTKTSSTLAWPIRHLGDAAYRLHAGVEDLDGLLDQLEKGQITITPTGNDQRQVKKAIEYAEKHMKQVDTAMMVYEREIRPRLKKLGR